MKKIILLCAVLITNISFSQTKDTFHFKSGEEFLKHCDFVNSLRDSFYANKYTDSILIELNKYRVSKGLNQLELDSNLIATAELQAVHNAQYDICTHINKQQDIKTLRDRAIKCGTSNHIEAEIASQISLFLLGLSEKLTVSEEIIFNFKNSSAHNNIMLQDNIKKCGISIHQSQLNKNHLHTIIVFSR